MHIHLFEFTDQSWCPHILRQYMTDYLHFVIVKARIYEPAINILADIIKNSGTDEILDLCSGSGGGVDLIQKELSNKFGRVIKVTLSDKFPSLPLYEEMKRISNGGVYYITESIDARNVPHNIKGIRTLFSSFHHFKPENAYSIIEDAVRNKKPICIFEGVGKTLIDFLGILLFTFIIFLITTPFYKPFSLNRLLLTYIIPVVPIMTLWDGLVSILRMYTPNDMMEMAKKISAASQTENYVWNAGQIKGKFGNRVMYLSGCPLS
jgi:hypothetical protein